MQPVSFEGAIEIKKPADMTDEQGITSRKAEDGEELMVPYHHLSEKAKDLDRNTVKAVYKAIEEASIDELNKIKYEDLPPIAHRYGG